MCRYPTIRTPRLLLRTWRDADLGPFAAMNADPAVMEYFPRTLSPAESDAIVARFLDQFDHEGYGRWAVEAPGVADFIGFIGLATPRFEAHFTPCVEVGWRLARAYWGRGYATEGALAALDFAFRELELDEVVSFAATKNWRSRAVMERIGMTRSARDDFDHPAIPEGHPLRRHVLYRVGRPGAPT